MTIYKQSLVITVLFVLLGLITVSAIAQPVCGTPKTQSQLLTEWQTCAQQGLSAGCLTAQRVQDIICAIPGGTTTNILSSNSFGSVCDGGTHPLSGYYGSLGAAQAVYPFITSLSQEIDYAALQKMSNVALGAVGSEHGSNTYLNKSMTIQGTCNIGNDTWLIRNADGISISGLAATATGITGNGIVLQFDGLWYSNLSNFYVATTSSSAVVALDIDGNVPGHAYSTRGVQANTFVNLLVNGGGSSYALALCRQGFSGGQCSENTFINFHGSNAASAVYYQIGYNALDNVLIGGDMQNYTTNGVYLLAGSISILGTSFESTTGYTQVNNSGCDITAKDGGVNNAIVVHGIRSESMCIYNGGASQLADLRGISQNLAGGFPAWVAATHYSLGDQTTFLDAGIEYPYVVTTPGTSGNSLPTACCNTVTDGGVTWTYSPFTAINVVAGWFDAASSNIDHVALIQAPYNFSSGPGNFGLKTTGGFIADGSNAAMEACTKGQSQVMCAYANPQATPQTLGSNLSLPAASQGLAASSLILAAPKGVLSGPVTFGGLNTCNSASKGYELYVSDATDPGRGAAIISGSGGGVKAICNGANWVAE